MNPGFLRLVVLRIRFESAMPPRMGERPPPSRPTATERQSLNYGAGLAEMAKTASSILGFTSIPLRAPTVVY